MVYDEWDNYARHRVQDYPGDGYVLTMTVLWMPGMKSDFADIRFADDNQSKLPYWVESYSAFVSATVHVRLARSAYVTMFYGNGAAVSESNGPAVFDFFDDFSAATINAVKWPTRTGSTISNGAVTVSGATGKLQAATAWLDGYELVFNIKMPGNASSQYSTFGADGSTKVVHFVTGSSGYGSPSYIALEVTNGTNKLSALDTTIWSNFKNVCLYRTGTTFGYRAGTWTAYSTTSSQAETLYPAIVTVSSGSLIYVNAVYQKKYAAIAPTAVLVGASAVRGQATLVSTFPRAITRDVGMSIPVIRMRAHEGHELYATALMSVTPAKLGVTQTHALEREARHFVHKSEIGATRVAHLARESRHRTNVHSGVTRILHSEREARHSTNVYIRGVPANHPVRIVGMFVPVPSLGVERVLAQPRDVGQSIPVLNALCERALATVRESGHSIQKTYTGVEWVLSSQRESGLYVPALAVSTETLSVLFRAAGMTTGVPSLVVDPVRVMERDCGVYVPAVSLRGLAGYGQSREAAMYVTRPIVQAERVFGQNVTVNMAVTPPSTQVEYILGSVREAAVSIPAGQILVTTRGDHFATAEMAVPTIMLGIDRAAGLVRAAGMSTVVEMKTGQWLIPTAPFVILVEKDGYTITLGKPIYTTSLRGGDPMIELTQYDTDTITVTIYDTDPDTGLQRLMPLTDRTVQAVLRGGKPQTTVTIPCTVISAGKASFSTTSANLSVPGLYTVHIIVTGTGFRKELPENRKDAQTILLNDALFTAP